MFQFRRGLCTGFVEALNQQYLRQDWWSAMADNPDLMVALRDDYLNVYARGCSLLELSRVHDGLKGKVHHKYLPEAAISTTHACLHDDRFCLPGKTWIPVDVKRLIGNAAAFADEEKTGVHRLVAANRNILDLEITFGLPDRKTLRLDFAALQCDPSQRKATMVFFEAKCFGNTGSLRAKEGAPKVLAQLASYEACLRRHKDELIASYRKVCGNLLALSGVRLRYQACPDLQASMQAIHRGEMPLEIDPEVRLIVFADPQARYDRAAWQVHADKLRHALHDRFLMCERAENWTHGISQY